MDTGKGIRTNVKGDSQTFGCMVQKTWNTWKWRCKNQHVYCDFLSFQHMSPITSTNCITFPSMPSSCAFLLLISKLWPGRAHEKTPCLFDNLDICHRKFFEQHRLKFEAVEMGASGELQKNQQKIHTQPFPKTSIYSFSSNPPSLPIFKFLLEVGDWLSGED